MGETVGHVNCNGEEFLISKQEACIRLQQQDNLPTRSVLFHHAVSLDNLVQPERLRHRHLQLSCLNLVDQLLQWSLHELVWSASI